MNRYLYTTFSFFSCMFLYPGQNSEFTPRAEMPIAITEKTIFYKLAENIVPIKVQQYGDRTGIVFINLHDAEATSVEAAKRILLNHGGLLIKFENNSQRNIRFRIGKYHYKLTPTGSLQRKEFKLLLTNSE